tara:strand:- start:5158 stop:5583 length:426 start_codon:yes stop_codon:yes gene_type:complete
MSETPQTDEYIQKLPGVGKNMYLPCRKCEANRYFKVLAHKTERSAKLECEVCGVKKSFTIKKPKKAGTGRRKTVSARMQWEELKESRGMDNADSYNMKGSFEADSALSHPKFGVGFVTESTPQKITVVFEDEVRELVHNRG